jgi:SAM-dependent methyltransferase
MPHDAAVSPGEAIAPEGQVDSEWSVYFVAVSDLPLSLPAGAASTLLAALDREHKIDRALETLGPIADRDVVVIGPGPAELERLRAAGARVSELATDGDDPWPMADAAADTIVSAWSGFRGVSAHDLAEADRVLRPGGRLLVIHDYGRDDVSRLRGDLPDYGLWSRRDGPFVRSGFRIRVLHCFWTFDSVEQATRFLGETFGEVGRTVGHELKRPRLSYNVAVYHRTRAAVAASS